MEEESNLYPPLPRAMEARSDIIEKIDPRPIIEEIKYFLMGKVKKNDEWVDDPLLKKFAITEFGAHDLTTLLLSICNIETSLGKLSDMEIKRRAYFATRTILLKMLVYWQEYGITNGVQLEYLTEIFFNLAYMVLKHPDEAGMRNWIGRIRSEIYAYKETPEQKKQESFFSRLNFFRR